MAQVKISSEEALKAMAASKGKSYYDDFVGEFVVGKGFIIKTSGGKFGAIEIRETPGDDWDKELGGCEHIELGYYDDIVTAVQVLEEE